jgi:hypothetical protein
MKTLLQLYKDYKESQRIKRNKAFYQCFKEEYNRYKIQEKEELKKRFFS